MIFANGVAIITDAFPKNELGMGLGTNMMALNLGAIVGYTLSGVMITYFGWRSIFYVNVPIGIFGTVWGYLRLKEIAVKPTTVKFDYAGTILYALGLSTILLALTIGDPLSARKYRDIGRGSCDFHRRNFRRTEAKIPYARPDTV